VLHGTVLYGLLPVVTLLLAAVCLVVSSVGFFRVVLFISVGYGYSMAAMAIAVVAVFGRDAGWITWAQTFLMFAYGVRLGTYLLVRERSAGYRSSQAEDRDRGSRSGIALKLAIWVSVSVLYVCMFLPLLSRYASADAGRRDPLALLSVVGVGVTAVGLIIETVADAQKRATKRRTPNRFCDRGLYRMVRYPNYFGELLV
jgi:steroid 5-alpha reductase family enzyme